MSLVLKLGDGSDFQISKLALSRGAGLRRVWKADLNFESVRYPEFAKQAFQCWRGESSATVGVGKLQNSATLLGASINEIELKSGADRVLVELELEECSPDYSAYFKPNRRVFSTTNLLSIFINNLDVLQFDIQAELRNAFDRADIPSIQRQISLSNKDKHSRVVLQTGENNFEFVRTLLGEHCWSKDSSVDGLHCQVPFANKTTNRLQIVGLSRIQLEGIEPLEQSWFKGGFWQFGFCTGELGIPISQDLSLSNRGAYWEYVRPRFSEVEWQNIYSRDCPVYLHDEEYGFDFFAHRAQDVLSLTPEGEIKSWTTRFIQLSTPDAINSVRSRFPVWAGFGVVKSFRETEEDGPWLEVALLDFEDTNPHPARWLTPSSGEAGKSGVVIYPKPDTLVAVSWSGVPGDPLLAYGNVRLHKANQPSPAMLFDAKDHFQIQVTDDYSFIVGGTRNDEIGKTLTIKAETEGIELAGQGVSLDLKEGKANVK